MADTWQSKTLGDVFSGSAQSLVSIQAEADNLFNKYSAVANQLGQKINVLNNLLNGTGDLLNKLQGTGLYVLQLPPSSGNLVNRIRNAQNPPTGNYSAGIVLGFSAVDLQAVIQSYQNAMDILTKPIEIPK